MSVIKSKKANNSLLGQWLLFVFPFQPISPPGIFFSEIKQTVISTELMFSKRYYPEKVS